jgi:hypothetical protein
MRMSRLLVLSLAVGTVLLAAPVFAQHHHHGHNHAHSWHQNHVIVDPHGHHVTSHHDNYHHVVPAHHDHHATYYTHNDTHYFYQAPPVVYRPGVQVAMRPATPIQPRAIEFGGFSHVDDLSGRLETLSNEFCLDLHYNYQHNPGFAETYREAYQILRAVKSAHANEHQGDKAALARTLADLDPLFHHVEEDVKGWSRDHHRQIGNLGIIDKMSQMEDLIHHLLHDVGIRPTHDGGHEQAPPPAGEIEIAPPPAP